MAHDDFTPIEAKTLPLRNSGRFWVATHAILGLAWLALAWWVVPRVEAIFMDFGLALPAMSAALIKASHFVIKYLYVVVVPLTAALLLIDLAIFDHLSADKDNPGRVHTGGLTLTLFLVALLVGSVGALLVPMVTFHSNLSN